MYCRSLKNIEVAMIPKRLVPAFAKYSPRLNDLIHECSPQLRFCTIPLIVLGNHQTRSGSWDILACSDPGLITPSDAKDHICCHALTAKNILVFLSLERTPSSKTSPGAAIHPNASFLGRCHQLWKHLSGAVLERTAVVSTVDFRFTPPNSCHYQNTDVCFGTLLCRG